MAIEVKFRGYVKFPEVKGTLIKFLASCPNGKKQDGTKRYVQLRCVQFGTTKAPEDGSYVVVEGFLNEDEYTGKDGETKKSIQVSVQKLEVAPPFEPASSGRAPSAPSHNPGPDPWDNA